MIQTNNRLDKNNNLKYSKSLYFFYNPLNETVKIGFSNDPKRRLKTIRYHSGIKGIDALLEYSYSGEYESDFHKLFSEYRTFGEWFKFTGTVKSYLEDLQKNEGINTDDFLYIRLLADKYHTTNIPDLPWGKLKKLVIEELNSVIDIEIKILKTINHKIFDYSSTWRTIFNKTMEVSILKKNGEMDFLKFYIEYNKGKYIYLDYYNK